MRDYDSELIYEQINYSNLIKDKTVNKLKKKRLLLDISKYNELFKEYSDIYYLLNDPISDLDNVKFKTYLQDRFNSVSIDMCSLLDKIHTSSMSKVLGVITASTLEAMVEIKFSKNDFHAKTVKPFIVQLEENVAFNLEEFIKTKISKVYTCTEYKVILERIKQTLEDKGFIFSTTIGTVNEVVFFKEDCKELVLYHKMPGILIGLFGKNIELFNTMHDVRVINIKEIKGVCNGS